MPRIGCQEKWCKKNDSKVEDILYVARHLNRQRIQADGIKIDIMVSTDIVAEGSHCVL